ncbi:hypothetical protein [Tenacibaculum sp. M341]|uniref:hypothetical protein n=1 Tax=Tenacibaculum sp. M341 TaxID=2530339 RepID=UPI001050E99B|nr:hypothetical protein [Tenacibaculum sp. M341]TCI91739.1 hypothetical protein EYW44_09285 [Tenacibaculum sp. M341]
MTKEELNRLIKIEKNLDLDSIKIDDIPIWRILRFSFRLNYLKRKTEFRNKTTKNKIKVIDVITNYLKSKRQFKKIKKLKIENIVFAFPRLTRISKMEYIDRFTDPLIEQTLIGESFVVFQKTLSGKKLEPRHNSNKVVYIDSIDIETFFTVPFQMVRLYVKHQKKIKNLFNLLKKEFDLGKKDLFSFYLKLSVFFVKKEKYKKKIKSLGAKRIFIVSREIYTSAIVAAKSLDVSVYELQHGITLEKTVLYSGIYNSVVDPDYFLAFGERSKGEFFALPNDKIINLGFPYIDYLKKRIKIDKKSINKSVLIASSPNITSEIFLITEKLAKNIKNFTFVIRLHPQEGIKEKEMKIIDNNDNIIIDEGTIDSFINILNYNIIIGDKSTVLYEGLALGKNVIKLNCENFDNEPKEDNFLYANSFQELVNHIKNCNHKKNKNDRTYSKFDSSKLEKTFKK